MLPKLSAALKFNVSFPEDLFMDLFLLSSTALAPAEVQHVAMQTANKYFSSLVFSFQLVCDRLR